jgi:hypothetical protein
MSWLDRLIFGVQVLAGGTAYTQRPKLNFASGATVADNPTTESTDVTIIGGRPPVTVQTTVAPAAFSAASWQVQVCRTGAASDVTFTLPASPSAGDIVECWNQDSGDYAHSLTVARNSLKINGGTSDVTIAPPTSYIRLVYIDTTTGWATSTAKL